MKNPDQAWTVVPRWGLEKNALKILGHEDEIEFIKKDEIMVRMIYASAACTIS